MNKDSILKYGLALLIFAAGIFAGKLFFGNSQGHEHIEVTTSENEAQVWTCSMHPQIRQDKPGKCPLCAMDLIPVKSAGSSSGSIDPDAIQMSDEAVALANIRTTVVGVDRTAPTREIRLYGVVKPNERRLHSLVSQTGGRIETLSVNYAGETVHKGQIVATLYSPELLNAQNELLEAGKMTSVQSTVLAAAREKLRRWKLTDAQIDEIERTGKASAALPLIADASGTVVAKRVEQGDYVNQGGVLFDLADLSSVWAIFDAYETDLPYLKIGDRVNFTLQNLAGQQFSGKISFVSPILDPATRTAKIRVEVPNPKLELKPEMYANATVQATLKQASDAIVVPKSAILWTGRRSVVYVRQPDTDAPVFKMREVTVGEALGDTYLVMSGLTAGEEIVTNGAFVIDASAQLEGKPSMMNQPETAQNSEHLQSVNLTVQGLCEMCKDRIETTAKNVKGISSAKWNAATKQLSLTCENANVARNETSKALAKAGHDTELHKADEAVYQSLPECCKYRKQ